MSSLAVKFKEKKPGQRACDEKNEKGILCCGHLKRWYTLSAEVSKEVGEDVEIYRCERCQALYRPAPGDVSTAGQRYQLRPVNILGAFVRKDRK